MSDKPITNQPLDELIANVSALPGQAEDIEAKRAVGLLAEELERERARAGISQAELAKRAGTTQRIVSQIENLDYQPSVDMALRLAEALGCRLEFRFVPEMDVEEVERTAAAMFPNIPNIDALVIKRLSSGAEVLVAHAKNMASLAKVDLDAAARALLEIAREAGIKGPRAGV